MCQEAIYLQYLAWTVHHRIYCYYANEDPNLHNIQLQTTDFKAFIKCCKYITIIT